MPTYIDILNESAVTFVTSQAYATHWGIQGPLWEAYSPNGEVQAFPTRQEAEAWRREQVQQAWQWHSRH